MIRKILFRTTAIELNAPGERDCAQFSENCKGNWGFVAKEPSEDVSGNKITKGNFKVKEILANLT